MNTQISSRQQLETVLNEIMKVYKPQSGILTRLAETYLGWIFGLIASFVIYHFNIHGWGLVFLVYVLVFEILNLGLSWGSALYTKYEKYEHLRIYRMTQLLILVLAVWGSFMFAFEWKIPIQYACFVVVWIVQLYFKSKSPRMETIPNLGLMPYIQRTDGRVLFQIFCAYRLSKLKQDERKELHEELYQERFYNIGLDSLSRLYAYPEEEDAIVKAVIQDYLNLMDEFTKRD